MITAKQIQKTNSKKRQNGLYLVFKDFNTCGMASILSGRNMIGMIERPYHTKCYRAQTEGKTFETCSTKQQALNAFEKL